VSPARSAASSSSASGAAAAAAAIPRCVHRGCGVRAPAGLLLRLRCIDPLCASYGRGRWAWFCSTACAAACLRASHACAPSAWYLVTAGVA
jgi:hypothetical protein